MATTGWREKEHGQRRIYHGADRVQEMLPQKMALWQTKYFKLKKSEKLHV